MLKTVLFDNEQYINMVGQYATTSLDYANKSKLYAPILNGKTGQYLLIKTGESWKQTIYYRVTRGLKSAFVSGQIFIICGIPMDMVGRIKTDDKIRAYQFQFSSRIINAPDDEYGREQCWIRLDDVLEECGLEYIDENALYHPLFVQRLQEILMGEYMAALDYLFNEKVIDVIASPAQDKVINQMISSEKDNFLLYLAPRFGKTFTMLEYTNRYMNITGNKTTLLVASKSLSANNSFMVDYNKFGYSGFTLQILSLCSKRIPDLLAEIETAMDNDVGDIILVTDEADFASSTVDSIEKLNMIKRNHNVVKHISMSGTGMGKVARINSDKDTEVIVVTDMDRIIAFDKGEETRVVKPKFFDISFKPLGRGEEVLNIRQSMEQKHSRAGLVDKVYELCDGNAYHPLLNPLNTTTMISCNTRKNSHLVRFADELGKKYKNLNVMVLSGTGVDDESDETNNMMAQSKVLTEINRMNVMSDDRRLVIITNQIGRRSFSIPSIDRVILLKDGEISDSDSQYFSRGGTWYQGKSFYEVVVVGFNINGNSLSGERQFDAFNNVRGINSFVKNNVDLDSEPKALNKKIATIFKYIDCFTLQEVGDKLRAVHFKGTDDGNYSRYIASLRKIQDLSKFTFTILTSIDGVNFNEGALSNVYGGRIVKSKSDLTKDDYYIKGEPFDVEEEQNPVSLAVIKNNENIKRNDKVTKVAYCHYLTLLPVIAIDTLNLNSLNDLMNFNQWSDYIDIDQDIFIQNMKIQRFSNHMETIFNLSKGYDEKTLQEKYMLLNKLSLQLGE